MALLVFSGPVETAVITVGDECSLSDAISAANGEVMPACAAEGIDADVIELSEDVVLTEVDNDTDGPNGLPSVSSDLQIRGNGFSIERADGAPRFRILHVAVDGALELVDLTVSRGESGGFPELVNGSGIYNRGRLTLTNSTLTENRGASYSSGGGVYNDGGTVVMTDSLVADNSASYAGAIHSTPTGVVRLHRTRLERNFAAEGGAVLNHGYLRVSESVLAENSGYVGGAIKNYGTLALDRSTLADNSASIQGGGLANDPSGVALITNSTLSGNGAPDGFGGAIINFGTLHMTNSTLSGNADTYLGGGLYAHSGFTTITHSTFWGNSGHALAVDSGQATVVLTRSVLAASGTDRNCRANFIIDGGGNWDDDGSCPRVGAITGLDPLLADNGGPTRTHALLAGSSAIGDDVCEQTLDQRGFERLFTGCDSGAYEFEATPPPTLFFSMAGQCPGNPSFLLNGATPGGAVLVAGAEQAGFSSVPGGVCGGTLLNLETPRPLVTLVADEFGFIEGRLELPGGRCGHHLQAVDLTTCGTSRAVQLPPG